MKHDWRKCTGINILILKRVGKFPVGRHGCRMEGIIKMYLNPSKPSGECVYQLASNIKKLCSAHAGAHTLTHAHAHAHTRTHTRAHTHAHTHTRARTHAHKHTRAHTRAHTHTHTHARARTHTHTHTKHSRVFTYGSQTNFMVRTESSNKIKVKPSSKGYINKSRRFVSVLASRLVQHCYKYGNEHLGSIFGRKFLDQLMNYTLFKEDWRSQCHGAISYSFYLRYE